jgi:hypothetical protein
LAIVSGSLVRSERSGSMKSLHSTCGASFRLDAGRADKHQLLDAVDMCRVDHIGSNDQIVVEEFTTQGVVGDDGAGLRSRQKHRLRPAFANQPNTAA